MKAVFFDVDGTLTSTKSGQAFKQHPEDVLVFPGVEAGLSFHKSQGYQLIAVSNQGGVAARHKTMDEAIAEMQYTLKLLPLLQSIYICPDFQGNVLYRVSSENIENWMRTSLEEPPFRKPGIGMILRAIEDLGEPLGESWMIGDRPEDQECAAAAGLNFLWADTWRQRFIPGNYQLEKLEQMG